MRRAGAASGARIRRPASSENVRPPQAVGAGASVLRPVVAIVGRPNVGKSTLFNRLVGRRQALVRDVPGVTRDRLYGLVAFDRWQATFVDTGGTPFAARSSSRSRRLTSCSSWWTSARA